MFQQGLLKHLRLYKPAKEELGADHEQVCKPRHFRDESYDVVNFTTLDYFYFGNYDAEIYVQTIIFD